MRRESRLRLVVENGVTRWEGGGLGRRGLDGLHKVILEILAVVAYPHDLRGRESSRLRPN
jgi:hypothetical protein